MTTCLIDAQHRNVFFDMLADDELFGGIPDTHTTSGGRIPNGFTVEGGVKISPQELRRSLTVVIAKYKNRGAKLLGCNTKVFK